MTVTVAVKPGRWAITACLALVFSYPFYAVPVQGYYRQLVPAFGGIGARVVTESAIWTYAIIVVVIALRLEPQTLAGLGLRRPTWVTLVVGLGGLAAMLVAGQGAGYLTYTVLRAPAHSDAQAAAIVGGSIIYAVVLAIRAGVIEETLFRGLAIEQLTTLTGNRWLAAAISMLAFILAHVLRFDWAQLIPVLR